MEHPHYSKAFGLALAAAFGLMLALNALAQSTAPKTDAAVQQPMRSVPGPR
jgi:hypothetical protein